MFDFFKKLNATKEEEILQYVKNEYPNEYARVRAQMELIQSVPTANI